MNQHHVTRANVRQLVDSVVSGEGDGGEGGGLGLGHRGGQGEEL